MKIKKAFLRITAISIIAFLFYYISYITQIGDSSFEKPISENFIDVITETEILNRGHNLLIDILITLLHFLPAFLLSSILAVLSGVVLTRIKWIDSISDYFIDFLRVLPSIVYITLFAYVINIKKLQTLLFGYGIEYVYFVVLLACFWPIIISTKDGISQVNRTTRMAIDQLNLNFNQKLFDFILPEAFPNIFNGIKISLGIAYLIAITCEFVTPRILGLGALLRQYEENEGYIVHSILVIIIIGIIGLILTSILDILERKLPWMIYQFKTEN